MAFVGKALSWGIQEAASMSAFKNVITGSYTDRALRFLAVHGSIHRFLLRCISSRLCDNAIEAMCRAMIKSEYSDAEGGNGLLRVVRDITNFAEGTKINIVNEVYELSDRGKLRWVMERLDRLGSERKARLLKRMFYNLILTSLNRKIVNLRLEGNENAVPNLTALLFSPSARCNLSCKGCANASDLGSPSTRISGRRVRGLPPESGEDATFEQMDYIIGQAKRLNVFHVAIIGKGEPFYDEVSKGNLFRLARKHYYTNFIVFTNGTTLSESDVAAMKALDNLLILVSIDGPEEVNDSRRGKSTYGKAMNLLRLMDKYNLIFGYSTMVFKGNYRHVVSPRFVNQMANMGCVIGVYLPFAPVDEEADAEMMLSDAEAKEYASMLREMDAVMDIPLVDVELFEKRQGCKARQGETIYVDGVTGKVYPCPKTPFSPEDCNLYANPHKDRLLEILNTRFFADYRCNHAKCSHCSLNFSSELDSFLRVPGIARGDRVRLEGLREKLDRVLQ